MNETIKTIPYGISDFANLRESNGYYVDNTWGIPLLEELPYQMFLRPRHFGKSLLLSILRYYYDINVKERFDELFGGTWIHDHPTPNHGKYLVMRFDFSKIEGETLEQIQSRFARNTKTVLDGFARRYQSHLPDGTTRQVLDAQGFSDGIDILMENLADSGKKICILIDEYDNFSNRLLARSGEDAYRALCHGTGFFKSFFSLLKAENQVVTKIFLTGVSPMTLDDVTSGFNIAVNVSRFPKLATVCGFTHDDIRTALNYYADAGRFPLDREQAFQLVTEWYDHYWFSELDEKQVCNPVLLLGFLVRCMANGVFPKDMVDPNLRTDYYKLRHIVTSNGQLNGKFHALETLATDGSVAIELIESFQAETLTKPESFLSLLFYYGMVTLDRQVGGKLLMTIPNQMMRKFIADFLLHGYADACKVNTRTMELADLLGNIADGGDWRPAIDMAAAVLKETLSVRDLMDGEKAIQAALAALLSTGTALAVRTEHRTGYGFADLALVPRIITFPDIQQGAIIEVKYIKKTEPVTESTKAVLLAAAKAQLEQYAADHHLAEEWRLKPQGPVNLLRLCIVFHGEELLFAEEI